ncbi:hypothetical protein MPL3356_250004 [Mesorhizobium plurifarium]|uniref:Uncharacterized protein n=1 Tax=Mesorhizobium plurifarium TaxID=69974 RepID=A0A090DNB5_MESPL|nr:hypothetical protein MPL3356_250004 [Mesorhizobium plurifarium]
MIHNQMFGAGSGVHRNHYLARVRRWPYVPNPNLH